MDDGGHLVLEDHGPVDVFVAALVQLEVGGHGWRESGDVSRLDHHLDLPLSHLLAKSKKRIKNKSAA